MGSPDFFFKRMLEELATDISAKDGKFSSQKFNEYSIDELLNFIDDTSVDTNKFYFFAGAAALRVMPSEDECDALNAYAYALNRFLELIGLNDIYK